MTGYEAARKWGISTGQVNKWCKSGKITATKIKDGNRWKWIIPDDHPQPVPQINGVPSIAREKAVLRKYGKRGYILRFAGTFSVRHMTQFLETTCAEVRTIYDDIVAGGGM